MVTDIQLLWTEMLIGQSPFKKSILEYFSISREIIFRQSIKIISGSINAKC